MKMKKQILSSSQELSQKYMMNFINRVPVTLVKGEGVWVWDENGKKYLDYVGGFAANNLGHCHPVIIKAITEQAKTLIHVSNQFYSLPQIKLAELLVQNSCLKKAFFSNSGAEANEGAVKLARRYGNLNLKGAWEVITTYGSFHGRTLAMVAATGQAKFQKSYIPLPAGFVNVEYNNIQAIQKATNEKTCAVMVELIQGEGGVNVPSPEYIKEVRSWCDQKGILLILDEIQTGIGRLGKLFGYQTFGIEPDVITLAKGVAGGTPIGVILANEKAAVFVPGDHGTTFGGNPLLCAIGYEVIKYIIENKIPENSQKMGAYFIKGLEELKKKYNFISEIRGMGLLIALEFNKDIAEDVLYDCLSKGLLINQLKPNTLRFIPPLIINQNEVNEGLKILDNVFSGLNI
jgi:acetylornithine/N-succinyldiaminopimelate aminotransferase